MEPRTAAPDTSCVLHDLPCELELETNSTGPPFDSFEDWLEAENGTQPRAVHPKMTPKAPDRRMPAFGTARRASRRVRYQRASLRCCRTHSPVVRLAGQSERHVIAKTDGEGAGGMSRDQNSLTPIAHRLFAGVGDSFVKLAFHAGAVGRCDSNRKVGGESHSSVFLLGQWCGAEGAPQSRAAPVRCRGGDRW